MKERTKGKRLLSLLLVCMMVLSLVPTAVLAETGAGADNIIGYISVAIVEPEVGATPDYDPTFDTNIEGEALNLIAIEWYKLPANQYTNSAGDAWQCMADTETFAIGYYYAPHMKFEAKPGYELSPRVRANINGLQHNTVFGSVYNTNTAGGAYAIAAYDFATLTTEPTPHTITFKANGHGGDSEGNLLVVTVEHGKRLNSVMSKENEKKLFPAPISENGKYYALTGYYTDHECTTRVNFNTLLIEDMTLYAEWVETPAPIEAVDITISVPDLSEGPMYISDFLSQIAWNSNLDSERFKSFVTVYDFETGKEVRGAEAAVFAEGSYYLEMEFVSIDYTWFSEDVSVKLNGTVLEEEINGNVPTKNSYIQPSSLVVYYLFGKAPSPMISGVDMTIVLPNYDGMSVQELPKSMQFSHNLGEMVRINDFFVLDPEGKKLLSPDDVLSGTGNYALAIALTSDDVQFNRRPRLVLNGKDESEYPEEKVLSGVDKDQKPYDTFVVMVHFSQLPKAYSILSGEDQEWTKGTATGIEVVSDADFAVFSEIQVDGAVVAPAHYDVVSGSTKVTLKPAYLETLALGAHTLDIVSTDGTASTSFTVKAAAVNPNDNTQGDQSNPNTGDSRHAALYAALLLVSLSGLAVAVMYQKRKLINE